MFLSHVILALKNMSTLNHPIYRIQVLKESAGAFNSKISERSDHQICILHSLQIDTSESGYKTEVCNNLAGLALS